MIAQGPKIKAHIIEIKIIMLIAVLLLSMAIAITPPTIKNMIKKLSISLTYSHNCQPPCQAEHKRK